MVTITVTVGLEEYKSYVSSDLAEEFRAECLKQFGPGARVEIVYEFDS